MVLNKFTVLNLCSSRIAGQDSQSARSCSTTANTYYFLCIKQNFFFFLDVIGCSLHQGSPQQANLRENLTIDFMPDALFYMELPQPTRVEQGAAI